MITGRVVKVHATSLVYLGLAHYWYPLEGAVRCLDTGSLVGPRQYRRNSLNQPSGIGPQSPDFKTKHPEKE